LHRSINYHTTCHSRFSISGTTSITAVVRLLYWAIPTLGRGEGAEAPGMVNAMAKCVLIGGGLSDAISDEVVTIGAVSQECMNFGPGRVVADG